MSQNIQDVAHRFTAVEGAQMGMQEEMLEIKIMAENMKKSNNNK